MLAVRHLSQVACLGLLLVCFMTLPRSPAKASTDGCSPDWQLDLQTYSGCDNIAALVPGNDTRVNLLLLLLDRHGFPNKPAAPVVNPVIEWREFQERFAAEIPASVSGFALGEGSRCRSNEAGAALFEAAVKAAAGLSPDERTDLLAARDKLKPDCAVRGGTGAPAAPLPEGMRTDAAKSFATYLRGSEAFYAGRFDEAGRDFTSLKGSAEPWLADTAAYMVARSQVNALQADAFDDYGTFKGSDKVDQEAALSAQAGLEDYLKARPSGRYAGSARGLLRRVDWLAGWTDKAAAAYTALLAQPASVRGIGDIALVEEIDSKLLPSLTPQMTKDPILLAVLDLKAMRRQKPRDGKAARIDLDAQRDAFASAKPLFELLAASAAFYLDGASAPVLKGIPDDTRRRDGDILWFSRQLLRGEALEAAADRNAEGFWKQLHPGAARPLEQATVELALALHQERHGDLAAVFAPGSLVTNPEMRIILLEHVADPRLLRERARDAAAPQRERSKALAALLYKELTRGRYAEFLADLGITPAVAAVAAPGSRPPARVTEAMLRAVTEGESAGDIGCPALSTTVSRLAHDANAHDRLCLAEFMRLNGLDGSALDTQPLQDALGGTPSLFPGKFNARGSIYQAIIADRQASAADRSFALYRAVNCYATSGVNHCGGADVSKPERRAWYTELKRSYPASHWAEMQTLWW